MKNLVIMMGLLIVGMQVLAATPVSVLSFKNKVGNVTCRQDWYWWSDNLGSAFQEMLINEMSGNSKIDLLERESIYDIEDREVNLINSEKSSHKIEKGNFTKAKYTVIGAVSEYEYCAESQKTKVNVSKVAGLLGLGGFAGAVAENIDDVKFGDAHAKVVVDIRVVETATGRIVKTVKAEGLAQRKNFKIDTTIGDHQSAQDTPVGEAARNAIAKANLEIQKIF